MYGYFVYIIHSQTVDKKFYVGYSSNPLERLKFHNNLRNKGYTQRYKPWSLIYVECFPTKKQALMRERGLKSSRGRAWIKQVILRLF